MSSPTRNDFQRDCDRIVYSTAFRRLVYKTQVFLNHEGDLFRTRMTHTLEVVQLARSMARAIGLHEDLVEAIALGHDLGHTPFGHAGQDALDACLKAHAPDAGGFEHNLQSLRVVDRLEATYPAHDGLNLTFETREGILKRCSRRNALRLVAREPGGVGQRFLDGTQPSLEAQLCNLADEIAYHVHDIDDGLRAGLLDVAQLGEVALFARCRDAALHEHPALAGKRLVADTLRRMLAAQVEDACTATRDAFAAAAPADAEAARRLPPLVAFSPAMRADSVQLKRFLHTRLYRHPRVAETVGRAQQVVADLYAGFAADPARWLPPEAGTSPRAVADHIAGMTDRYALREHERLTGQRLFG